MTIQQHASFDSSAAELNATSKLVKAWESKNAKNAAKAGGISLMALSLAACGGSDDVAVDLTPFDQSDIDAAVAAVDLTSDNAVAIVAALTTEAGAAFGSVDAAVAYGIASVDITSDNAALIAAAVAAVDTTADDATAVSLALRNAAADAGVTGTSTMTNAELITAIKTANDTAIANGVDLTTDNDTAIDAAIAALGFTGITTLAQMNAAYDALVNPAAVDTTVTLTSSIDNKSTTGGNDTYYALNAGDLATGDVISAGEGTDTVIATISDDATVRPVMTSVETVNVTISATSAADSSVLNLDQSTGVTSVNINTHVSVNGSEDDFTLSGVGTAAVMTITDNLGSGNLDNAYTATYSGVSGTSDVATVNVATTTADLELGAITVAGVETLTVNATGGFDASYGLAADAATTLTLNAAADSTATDATGGTVSVTAALVTTLNVNASNDLTISDATSGLLKVATVNIDSAVADKGVTMTDMVTTNAATDTEVLTFNITGAGDATVGENTTWSANNSGVAEDQIVVAGGTSTGNIAYTTDTDVANLVTTGSGDDTVTLGGVLDADDSINLGAGSNDTIAIAVTFGAGGTDNADIFFTDATATDDPTITGVEFAQINVAGTMAAQEFSVGGSTTFADTVVLSSAAAKDVGNNNLTISGLSATQGVKLGNLVDLDQATVIMSLADATGTSDSLSITTDGLNATATATYEGMTVNDVETVNVDLASTAAANTTIAAGALAFANATAVNLTGSKITSATVTAADTATIDASAITGATTLEFDNNAKDYIIKGSATAANTFTMGTKLDDGDTITGGSATTDALSATVSGLNATTGKLNITGVEAIELLTATTASTIDASLISGATEIQITGDGTAAGDGSQNVTFTNLAAGVEIGLGSNTSAGADGYKATAAIGLADATSSSDTVTVNLGARDTDADITATLTGTGIETLKLVDSATAKDSTVNVNGFAATTLDIDGGKAGELLDLSGAILNAATTTVDASGFLGVLTASAATNTGTTFTAKTTVGTLTGGAAADTFTIGSTSNFLDASVGTVAGGVGSDTLNVFAGGSSFDLDAVTAVETINITFDDVAGFTIGAGGGSDATITAATVTYAGGKSGEVYGSGSTGVLTDVAGRVIDASNLLGSIEVTFGDDALVVTNISDPVTITGGQSAVDVVNLVMTNSNTGTFTMSGVETLEAGNITGTSTIDLTNVTGLTGITLHNSAGTGKDFVISKMAADTAITLGVSGSTIFKTQKVDIDLADATGTSDTVTVNLADTDSTTTVATIDFDAIETLTLALANTTEGHNVALENNLTASTVVVTGTNVAADLILSSIEAGITTVNASGLAGELTIADTARGSDAMTITGGTGADTIEMENAADVLTGGAGTVSDEVQVTFSGSGGSMVVDLSSTTDQVTLFNGVANSAAQTGFEDIDVSAYTQTGSVGADITGSTGANVIVGTGYADTIRGGEGADTINGGAGAVSDNLTGGAGADTFMYNVVDTSTATAMDVISDFAASSDILSFDTTGDGASTGDAVITDSAKFTTGVISDTTIVNAIAADTTIADAIAEFLAAADFDDNDVGGFVWSGDAYIVHADANGAAGNIIMLEGVSTLTTVAELTTTDTFIIT